LAGWSAVRLGDPAGPRLVVFVHGGFWRARFDAAWIAELAHAWAQRGDCVWNLEYPRVGMPGGGWPGTAEAVGAAVEAALRAAAGRPVALVGHSAGGHLAAWAARDRPVASVVSLAGVLDLRRAHAQRLGASAVADLADERAPAGAFFAAASPIERLPLGSPALLVHGDADANVPIEQSRRYAEAARAAGDVCELVELSGADHFAITDPSGPAWPALERWLGGLGADG